MLPFKIARTLPVYFYGSVKFTSLKGTVVIDGPISRGMIGFGQAYEMMTRFSGTSELNLQGKIVFKGYMQFGKDYFVYVQPNAFCQLGNMASLASKGKLICTKKIVLGDYARIGSESQLMDTNFHQLIDTLTGETYPKSGEIHLGNFNFIGNRVSIMSNTITPENSIVASNSLCNKDYSSLGNNILIGGMPAKLIKQNIARDWNGEKERLDNHLKNRLF